VSNEFNYIVRLKGTNVDGSKKIPYALTDIKGIGIRFGNAVVKALKMNKKRHEGHEREIPNAHIFHAILPIGFAAIWILD